MTATRTFLDDRGAAITEGAEVQVLYVDRTRGAELWMHRGTVVGFTRNRVAIRFPARNKPRTVGNECLRVIAAVEDGAR